MSSNNTNNNTTAAGGDDKPFTDTTAQPIGTVLAVEITRTDDNGTKTVEEQLISPTGSVVSRNSNSSVFNGITPANPSSGTSSTRSPSLTSPTKGSITLMKFHRGSTPNDDGSKASSRRSSLLGGLNATRTRADPSLADFDRQPGCHPGRHTYSAKMDRAALECWYKLFCVCGENRTKAVRRSFIDVYSNGVVVNAPRACCCMTPTDNATLRYWDDPRVAHIGKGGWCSPVPWLFPHCCNCCGETLFFNQCCGCPNGFGHCTLCVPPCFCSTDMFLGLEEGEAQRLAVSLNGARDRYAISNPLTRIMGM